VATLGIFWFRMKLLRNVFVFAFAPLLLSPAAFADTLDTGFQSPPDSAKPQTWWHWMNGNITKEGITADLGAMKEIGLGGATIVNVDSGIPRGTVNFMSPEWRDDFKFAMQEASRLGLQMGVENCAGWSSSGGPWNVASNAMMHVVTSEIHLTGPTNFSGEVPQPRGQLDYYRDIAVLAFRTPDGENAKRAQPKITSSASDVDVSSLADGQNFTVVTLPLPQPSHPQFFQFQFPEPFAARAVQFTPERAASGAQGKIEFSDDGTHFRECGRFALSHRPTRPVIVSLNNAGTHRFYRVVFESMAPDAIGITLRGIEFTQRLRVGDFETKDGDNGQFVTLMSDDNRSAAGAALSRSKIIDLTKKIGADGSLKWKVPPGDWTILRVGFTPTGRENHPAPLEGRGLENDKFSRVALDAHWAGFMQKIVDDIGPLAGKTLNNSLIDSYEVGGQNWTADFSDEFKKRRGYDPTPFLAAFTGRVVENPQLTERFLWDVRRTIADLFADNYYGYFAELCHSNGLLAAIEPYTGPFESLQCGKPADIVMGEFWASGQQIGTSVKLAASVAHIYGKQIVGAESFTASPGGQHGRWLDDPYSLKALGDYQYCTGLNRFIFHRYAMQPWTNRWPGMTMGQWGFHFERTETWWQQGKPWIDYISRAQFMLQQGRYVADVAYFNGESAPSEMRQGNPPLPPGYQFDAINADVLLHHAGVTNGRLNLDGGASYAVLVLPPDDPNMTPALLQRISDFVRAGLTVVGAKPQHSPSLENYPHCDSQVQSLAKKLWGKVNGSNITENVFGKGRVVWGQPLYTVLFELNALPDFAFHGSDTNSKIIYCHRQTDGAEIYFVSNQRAQSDAAECSFRISGKTPELWNALTGEIYPAPIWHEDNGRTYVPLRFGPADSMFVVFRKDSGGDHFVSLDVQTKSNYEVIGGKGSWVHVRAFGPIDGEFRAASGKVSKVSVLQPPEVPPIAGDWQLNFPTNWGAPDSITLDKLISWSEHTNTGVKYFSGTATYEKEIQIPTNAIGWDIWLDLGNVKNFAEVSLNGKSLGVLWKPPFRVNLQNAVRAGTNLLQIKVTNLWPNRLIGDEQLPADREWNGKQLKEWPHWVLDGQPSPTGRYTFTTWHHWLKDQTPIESGLLGPVTISAAQVIPIRPE
jgi:hypothetical protein